MARLAIFLEQHRNDDAIITLSREVKEALENATYCIFESDCSHRNIQADAATLINRWHQSQAQYLEELPEDYLLSARKYFKKMHAKMLAQNPQLTIQLGQVKDDIRLILPLSLVHDMVNVKHNLDFLDIKLANHAKTRRKRVRYLASVKEELIAYLGLKLNFHEQIEIYRYAGKEIARGKDFKAAQEEVMIAYHQQDIQKLSDSLSARKGYAKSSSFFGMFRQTKTNLDDTMSVRNAASDTRTGQVRDILNGQPI